MEIDLNADLGEGMRLRRSAARSRELREYRVRLARGRRQLPCAIACAGRSRRVSPLARIRASTIPRISAARRWIFPASRFTRACCISWARWPRSCKAEGGRIAHVKPHGALYNQAAKNPEIAEAIVAAIRDFDPSLLVFGLANSNLVDAARKANMVAIEEVFADRGYRADGSLVPRKDPGALLDDEEAVLDPHAGDGNASIASRRSAGSGCRSTRRPSAFTATARTRWHSPGGFAARLKRRASKFARRTRPRFDDAVSVRCADSPLAPCHAASRTDTSRNLNASRIRGAFS